MNKRIFYAFSGIMVLPLSGMVYSWSVFSSIIGEKFPCWSRASLFMTFTLLMLFFCLGGLLGGFLSGKIKSSYYVWMAAFLFLFGFLLLLKLSHYLLFI